nr:Rv2175c family DNA-binding protein [Microvirga tunisiensis]
MRLEWLVTPDPALGGASPIEALRQGNVTEVIQLARS